MGLLLLCTAMVLVSCSGEDGEQGPQGPAGIQGPQGPTGPQGPAGQDGAAGQDGMDGQAGADGADGTDGQDGVDGNANVQQYKISLADWPGGAIIEFSLPIDVQDRSNYAFFYYLNNSSWIFSVPGRMLDGSYYSSVWLTVDTIDPDGYIFFNNSADNAPYQVSAGTYNELIIVAVELNSMGAKVNGDNLLNSLKTAGIDVNDYHAVAAYFGLE